MASVRERRRADGTRSFAVLWRDPETGRQLQVDTRSRKLRARFEALAASDREEIARELRSLGVGHVVLSTGGDWLKPLVGFLRTERKRR